MFPILPTIISILGWVLVLLGMPPIAQLPADVSFHFNLITVNALFGGFLYTNYSLLIGVLDNEIVRKVKNTSIIPKRNRHIQKGIICATVSVVAGLYLVLFPQKEGMCFRTIYCLMQNTEITFMAFLVLYFVLSLKEMGALVKAMHNPKEAGAKQDVEELRKMIIEKSTRGRKGS